ncbi:hypothetical protein PSH66_27250 [Pseudomonas sp. FP597]|uniref:hypothetical protein n=1 Tax=Pseudomonas sp. FP597 TaxID=2954096 RepID=UPI00273262EA|nr:hypothetical protein [Pseudomonas sp. FP597]WLI06231.1 hypothetical protein PSH66_27250 [Pseudomonas sp. FP597]
MIGNTLIAGCRHVLKQREQEVGLAIHREMKWNWPQAPSCRTPRQTQFFKTVNELFLHKLEQLNMFEYLQFLALYLAIEAKPYIPLMQIISTSVATLAGLFTIANVIHHW